MTNQRRHITQPTTAMLAAAERKLAATHPHGRNVACFMRDKEFASDFWFPQERQEVHVVLEEIGKRLTQAKLDGLFEKDIELYNQTVDKLKKALSNE